MEPAEREDCRLLGPAARPLLITIILGLRPDLDPVVVGGAVERIVLSDENSHDHALLWNEVETVLAELRGTRPQSAHAQSKLTGLPADAASGPDWFCDGE
jgi:hypothetical protein